MTTFLLACGGLVVLSGLFYLFPQRRAGSSEEDLAQANLEWYRLRQAELAEMGDEALEDDARLRLLEDERPGTDQTQPVRQSFPVWILMPIVAVFSGVIYYQLGAAPDVLIVRQMEGLGEQATPAETQNLISTIEARSSQRPENLHYVALLGRHYMGQQQYASASKAYGALVEASPGDAQSLAYAAQAEYLAAGRQLSPRARLRAEQALAANPHQRTALGLLGMASFEEGQFRAAIDYWQRLMAMETPGSESSQMIASVIARAQEQLGEGGGGDAPAPAVTTAASEAGAGVTVRVALPEGAQTNPADTVFVLARNAESDSRMPIAVQRLTAAQLPLTLRLDDSTSMAGQKISSVASVIVAVQVSPAGRPGEANASWLGEIGPLAPSLQGEPLDIQLRANTP